MSDTPPDFDLKFLPDWLKETPAKNAYADYEGEDSERHERRFSKSGPRQRDSHKPRDDRRRKEGHRDHPPRRRDNEPQRPQQDRSHAQAPTVEKKAQVKIDFLPDHHCVLALAKQIKSSHRAYPLFDLARMFLEKPDRHYIKITSTDPSAVLFQCGEKGAVSFDRSSVERNAFERLKHTYYTEETIQGEPPKGNYSNVARCRLSGRLLGPTNHHAYQPGLRKLYEERFSRRMSFTEYQREIEVVTDPAAIEAWKEQSRSVTKFKTLQENEPKEFANAAEAERHFRETYLGTVVRSGVAFDVGGEVSRNLPDRALVSAIRQAWEAENRFPGQLMNHLRREFIKAGLYIFKHRNRVQLVSAIRPTPFNGNQQSLSETVSGILKIIGSTPKCTRAILATKVQESQEGDPTKIKAQLAADFHWLVQAGHVIELHNGILELPVVPNPAAPKGGEKVPQPGGSAKPATAESKTEEPTPEAPLKTGEAETPAPLPVEKDEASPEPEP